MITADELIAGLKDVRTLLIAYSRLRRDYLKGEQSEASMDDLNNLVFDTKRVYPQFRSCYMGWLAKLEQFHYQEFTEVHRLQFEQVEAAFTEMQRFADTFLYASKTKDLARMNEALAGLRALV